MRVDTRLWLLRAGMVGAPNSPAAAGEGNGKSAWAAEQTLRVQSLKPRVW